MFFQQGRGEGIRQEPFRAVKGPGADMREAYAAPCFIHLGVCFVNLSHHECSLKVKNLINNVGCVKILVNGHQFR